MFFVRSVIISFKHRLMTCSSSYDRATTPVPFKGPSVLKFVRVKENVSFDHLNSCIARLFEMAECELD